jgi:hypothetical protein
VAKLSELLDPNYYSPILIAEPEEIADVVHKIDAPLINNSDVRKIGMHEKKLREGKVAEIACARLSYIPFAPYKIVSCVMRMWSGCLASAKTIALETRSGPNTPEKREKTFWKIDARAIRDPYYFMGVSSSTVFKKLRKQEYSLDGVPKELIEKYRLRT